MKSANNRSIEFNSILQTLISSAKILQEASEDSLLAVPSGPLVGVAIDRLQTIKVSTNTRLYIIRLRAHSRFH